MQVHKQLDRIKILHIIDSLAVAGAERLLLGLLRRLDRTRYEVTVVYFTPGRWVSEVAAMGFRLHRVCCRNRFDPLIWPQMLRIVWAERPDMVHTHLFKSGHSFPQ
jgi:hypothetical protein